MRAAPTVVLILSIAFITAASVAQQGGGNGDEPAEKAFKNIQVLKGSKAKDILPSMQFIAASLGVECEFCHVVGPDGHLQAASDDKPEKHAAREMILMMRDINAKNFNGRTQVTCATCHNGHPNPQSTPPVPGLVTPKFAEEDPKAAPLPEAHTVFDKYVTALGGESAVAGLKSLDLHGKVTVGQGKPAMIETLQSSPNMAVDKIGSGDKAQIRGYNGVVGWATTGQGSRVFKGDQAARSMRDAEFYRDPQLEKRFQKTRVLGRATIGDAKVVVVQGNLPGDAVERLYFDESTGLLVRDQLLTNTILGRMPDVTDLSDYRTVNGVQVPFMIVRSSTRGQTVKQYATADANTAIDATMFVAPTGK
jgi:hypothetical protein